MRPAAKLALAPILVGALLLAACEDSSEVTTTEEPRDPTALELLYQYRSTLYTRTIAADASPAPDSGEELTTVDGIAAEAAPGPGHVAVLGAGSRNAAPTLTLFDPDEGDSTEIGPGLHPTWNATGDRLAYLRPADPDRCAAERCPDGGEVVALDPAVPDDAEVVLDTGTWVPELWAGEHLVVADTTAPDEITVVASDGEVSTPDMGRPMAASPDGEWLLVARSDTEPEGFVRFTDGEPQGDLAAIDKGELETFTQVRWSPASDRVAAVLKGGTDAQVVTMSPDDPTPEPLAGSEGAVGRLMWGPGGDALAFSRLGEDEAGTPALQATFCVLDAGDCSVVLQWQQGVTMLRLQ
ncbi:MAG: hypothetical protein ACRDKB_05385 [Actinomycetota bacterium]